MPKQDDRSTRISIRARRCAGWSRISSRCRTRFSTAGCVEIAQTFFGFTDEQHHARQLGGPVRRGAAQDECGGLAAAGAAAKQARSRVSDQRLRRSARRLRHGRVHSVPAHRRSGVSPARGSHVRKRLAAATNVAISTPRALREAMARLFEHFVAHNARACAISLPPDFAPTQRLRRPGRDGLGQDRAPRRANAARANAGPSPTSCSGRWPNSARSITCRST